jgi:Ca2+-binding EF-hand superfamily protein
MSKKDIQAKDLQTILAKDVATKNPIFSNDSISELHALFSLYADPRQRRVDVKDILMTAKTLGLDARYDIVFRVLLEVSESSGDALNFEEFLKALTARIVFFFVYLRETHSAKKEEEPTSVCTTCKEEEN